MMVQFESGADIFTLWWHELYRT